MTHLDENIATIDADIHARQTAFAQSSSTSNSGTTTRDRMESAFAAGTFAFETVKFLSPRIIAISNPASIAIVAGSAALGAFGPDIIEALFGGSTSESVSKSFEQRLAELTRGSAGATGETRELLTFELERLRRDIQDDAVASQNRIDQIRSSQTMAESLPGNIVADKLRVENEPELAILRDELIVLQELRDRVAIALRKLAENDEPSLSECLRRLCERLDDLVPAAPDGLGGPLSDEGIRPRFSGGGLSSRLLRERQFASLSVSDADGGFFGGSRLLPETATPIQDRLNALVDEERSVGRLVETHRKLIDEKKRLALTNQVIIDGEKLIDEAAQRAGASIASAFERAIFEGGSLSDILKDLGRDLSRIGVQTFVTGPLQGGLTSILNGSIFGPSASGIPPGAIDESGAFGGIGQVFAGADSIIAANPGIFHGGGVAWRTNVPSRLVPASFFADVPRFDQGGFAGFRNDEIPAILHRGETVRTPAQEAALGRRMEGGVTVNVTINANGGAGDVNSMRFAAQQSFAEAARQLKRADARNN